MSNGRFGLPEQSESHAQRTEGGRQGGSGGTPGPGVPSPKGSVAAQGERLNGHLSARLQPEVRTLLCLRERPLVSPSWNDARAGGVEEDQGVNPVMR